MDEIYGKLRAEILSKKPMCPVYPTKTATEIHHKRGRVGYADEWAEQNKISLYIDKRFFLAVSRDGHRKIEENPTWAKEMGFSEPRKQSSNFKPKYTSYEL